MHMEAGEVGVTAMQQRVVMVTEKENEHVNLYLITPPKKIFFVNHRTKIISTSLVLLNPVQVSI